MDEKKIIEAREKIGLLFRNKRKEIGLTQTQLAELCSVTFQTINKIEKGKFAYSVDLLIKLSVILEIPINIDMEEIIKDSRFILQKSKEPGKWVCTDSLNQIVCNFENKKFNETQNFVLLNDNKYEALSLATIMREFGDWLIAKHPEKI